jgi:hypothetical protein
MLTTPKRFQFVFFFAFVLPLEGGNIHIHTYTCND